MIEIWFLNRTRNPRESDRFSLHDVYYKGWLLATEALRAQEKIHVSSYQTTTPIPCIREKKKKKKKVRYFLNEPHIIANQSFLTVQFMKNNISLLLFIISERIRVTRSVNSC